jgi:hypothetical protein
VERLRGVMLQHAGTGCQCIAIPKSLPDQHRLSVAGACPSEVVNAVAATTSNIVCERRQKDTEALFC